MTYISYKIGLNKMVNKLPLSDLNMDNNNNSLK